MEPRATILRDREGNERVVLDLADFQALVDAGEAAAHGLPDLTTVVQKLGVVLANRRDDCVDLDEFLTRYDAAHRAG